MIKKIDKQIVNLAIPNIVSNISIPLLSTVDTLLMGRLSVMHLAAIGVGSMIFNMLYWNFGFLRMGTTGMVAQAYGGNNMDLISLLLGRGIILATIIAGLIILFSSPLLELSNTFYHVSPEAEGYVRDYYSIRVWAAPATMILYVIFGWFFGMQNSIYPLVITVFINVLNMLVSYHCVDNLGMGTKGVAIGTVFAQYAGLLLAFVLISRKYSTLIQQFNLKQLFDVDAISKFLIINRDIFIRTFCLTFVFSFFYSQSFKLGVIVMGVNVILQQFINWMSYIVDGFAYASESLVGKYMGRKDKIALNEVIKKSFIWGCVVAVFCTLLFFAYGDKIVTFFSDDAIIIEEASKLYHFVWIFPIIGFASYIWDGVFVGLLASRSMRDSMLLALIVFIFSFYAQEGRSDGSHIWIALCCFMVARTFFQSLFFYKKGYNLQ